MSDSEEIDSKSPIRLGLRENLSQFSLLVLVNAFVGGMVGLERTVVPLIGSEEFKIASATVIASFIISFGSTKAFTNLISGQLADSLGRKRVLVLGWIVGLPVPFMSSGQTRGRCRTLCHPKETDKKQSQPSYSYALS